MAGYQNNTGPTSEYNTGLPTNVAASGIDTKYHLVPNKRPVKNPDPNPGSKKSSILTKILCWPFTTFFEIEPPKDEE